MRLLPGSRSAPFRGGGVQGAGRTASPMRSRSKVPTAHLCGIRNIRSVPPLTVQRA